MSELTKLSASRIKTAQQCSWTYWCNYKLKLPQSGNDGSSRGTICHNVFELLGDHHKSEFNKIIKEGTIWNTKVVASQVKKEAEELSVSDKENLDLIDEMIVNGLSVISLEILKKNLSSQNLKNSLISKSTKKIKELDTR